MRPSRRWFPTDFISQVAWFLNFYTQFAIVAESLGFSDAKVKQVKGDNDVMQFLGDAEAQLKAFQKAAAEYRRIITEGDIGDPQPQFPAAPALALPIAVMTGIFERLVKLVKQIQDSDNYTYEIGALLGILPADKVKIPLADKKLVIKTQPLPASQIEVEFVRGDSDGIFLQTQTGTATKWSDGERFTKSPAILTIAADAPAVVRIRGRYLDGNTPAGEFSEIAEEITQP